MTPLHDFRATPFDFKVRHKHVECKDRSVKSIVTGGAGFVGSHVVDELVRLGHDVTVLDDLSGGFADNVDTAARFVKGSVTDSGLVDALYAEHRFDYTYHLAAYAAEGLSHFIRRFNYTNIWSEALT